MGCILAHEQSDMCKFDKKCTRNLCSFGHTKSIEVESDDQESEDYNESEEIEGEFCDFFVEMFDNIDYLIDNYGTT